MNAERRAGRRTVVRQRPASRVEQFPGDKIRVRGVVCVGDGRGAGTVGNGRVLGVESVERRPAGNGAEHGDIYARLSGHAKRGDGDCRLLGSRRAVVVGNWRWRRLVALSGVVCPFVAGNVAVKADVYRASRAVDDRQRLREHVEAGLCDDSPVVGGQDAARVKCVLPQLDRHWRERFEVKLHDKPGQADGRNLLCPRERQLALFANRDNHIRAIRVCRRGWDALGVRRGRADGPQPEASIERLSDNVCRRVVQKPCVLEIHDRVGRRRRRDAASVDGQVWLVCAGERLAGNERTLRRRRCANVAIHERGGGRDERIGRADGECADRCDGSALPTRSLVNVEHDVGAGRRACHVRRPKGRHVCVSAGRSVGAGQRRCCCGQHACCGICRTGAIVENHSPSDFPGSGELSERQGHCVDVVCKYSDTDADRGDVAGHGAGCELEVLRANVVCSRCGRVDKQRVAGAFNRVNRSAGIERCDLVCSGNNVERVGDVDCADGKVDAIRPSKDECRPIAAACGGGDVDDARNLGGRGCGQCRVGNDCGARLLVNNSAVDA